MNKPLETGIVHLEDLPSNLIFIGLKDNFKEKLLNSIKTNFTSINDFTKLIDKNIYFYFNLKNNQKIRLDCLIKIIKILGKYCDKINLKNLDEDIKIMGTKRGNIYIKNPKLPFNFNNKSGAYFISSIFFDGGIDRQFKPHYSNMDLSMRKRVVDSVKDIFGEIKSKEINYKNRVFVRFPKVIGILLNCCFNIGIGNKIYHNNKTPYFIFKLNKKEKSCFVKQAFDDDGSVSVNKKMIRIVGVSDVKKQDFGNKKTIRNFCLLNDLKKLLLNLGIESNPIRLSRKTFSNKEYNKKGEFYRHVFYFSISDRKNLERFYKNIGFNLKYKHKRLENILKSYKQWQLRKGEIYLIALEKARLLQEKYGFFDNMLLTKEIKRQYRQTVRITKKLLKDKKIKILEKAKPTGRGWIPEKYVLI